MKKIKRELYALALSLGIIFLSSCRHDDEQEIKTFNYINKEDGVEYHFVDDNTFYNVLKDNCDGMNFVMNDQTDKLIDLESLVNNETGVYTKYKDDMVYFSKDMNDDKKLDLVYYAETSVDNIVVKLFDDKYNQILIGPYLRIVLLDDKYCEIDAFALTDDKSGVYDGNGTPLIWDGLEIEEINNGDNCYIKGTGIVSKQEAMHILNDYLSWYLLHDEYLLNEARINNNYSLRLKFNDNEC